MPTQYPSLRTSPLLILAEGRERTCSRRRSFRKCIFGECTGPFANKFAPTPAGQKRDCSGSSASRASGTACPRGVPIVTHKSAFDSGRRPWSELVREDGRSENAFSENVPALSRTSSLLRPPGRSEIVQALQLQELPEPHAHAEYPSLRTSPLLILAEGRGSELVREDGRSENAFSENVSALSRTSSLLRPPGRSEIVQALQLQELPEPHAHAGYQSLRTSPLLILAGGRGSELVREDGRSENAFSENIPALSRTSSLLRPPGRSEIVQALQLQELPEPHAHAESPSLAQVRF